VEDRSLLVDTSILIDYFRKQNKKQTTLYQLVEKEYRLHISTITYFEYIAGSNNRDFDQYTLTKYTIIPFDQAQALRASALFQELKQQNQLIEFRDIFIASCAIELDMPLVTSNLKHFERFKQLVLFKW